MYTLIVIIGIVSGSGSPVGVTSQTVGKFGNLDDCKRAAEVPINRRYYFGVESLKGNLLVLHVQRKLSAMASAGIFDFQSGRASRLQQGEMRPGCPRNLVLRASATVGRIPKAL